MQKNSQIDEQNNSQIDEQKNDQIDKQINNQTDSEFEENKIETDNINNSSFDKFLKEISDDYRNCEPQLRKVFEPFTERYRAAKSRSIAWAITFLYNPNFSIQIKGGAAIHVQPESVK
ncbi:12197_t:CDS:2, partial [Dentiscutata heterogama]